MISRAEVVRRARLLWPAGSVPYSQDTIHPGTGYRQDCSGFVSMCWGIPPNAAPGGWGGLNTVTLVTGGWMREIPASDLRPGDAIGICGPNTGGDDGHIVLFEGWLNDVPNDDRYWMYEQAGGQRGPIHRVTEYPYGGSGGAWRAYRFRDIIDTPEETVTPKELIDLLKATVMHNDDFGNHSVWDILMDGWRAVHVPVPHIAKTVDILAARPETSPVTLPPEDRAQMVAEVVGALRADLSRVVGDAFNLYAAALVKAVNDDAAARMRE